MSVCFESGNSVLPGQVPKLAEPNHPTKSTAAAAVVETSDSETPRTVAKLCQENVAAPLLQKVSPVITVVNTPITVVKTIGGGGGGAGATSHFTLVNSGGAVKSPPTITVVNAPPITVVKTISEQQVKSEVGCSANNNNNNNGNLSSAAAEKPSSMHNVFVKKSAPSSENANVAAMPDIPQSHKLLTANSFPTSNVLSNLGTSPILKTANGQRSINAGGKVKILSNVVMPGAGPNPGTPGPSNVLLNKSQRYYQQKVIGNGATKYLNRPPDKRVFYPIHKSQLKTLSGYKPASTAVRTSNHLPGVQRTGAGLRTIPPQRPPPPSLPNKTNYIGKHAVQAQKARPKLKAKTSPINHRPVQQPPQPIEQQSAQMIFNQALTAQILETLSDKEAPQQHKSYAKYEPQKHHHHHHEMVSKPEPPSRQSMSTLDTLSFVCQAVLLDHNYNATLPSEPTPSPVVVPTPPMNGSAQFSPVSNYQTGITSVKRNRTSSQTIVQRDDDAASDISEERKVDTEGEETDTAPEAEAVSNEANDRYGDYVTRCICGFIHDDGYMIECDKCKVWQHVRCVVKTKKVPEDYLCEECDPSKHTDRQKARALQQQWMREIQERDAKLRKEQMALSETDSSDGETGKNNRRKEPPRRQRRDSVQNRSSNKPNKRKDRKVPAKRSSKGKQSHDDEKVPQLRQWIENYEEAVTNHYSPELRARISSVRVNGAHSELSGSVDPSVNKCKVQTVPPGVKCLVAAASLPMGTPVVELRGKYMLSTQHRATTRQQRPGPFLFFHTVVKDTEVCVDTRTYGNCARFVRRSCTPNAELQHVLEKGAVHLYVVTTKSVDRGSELTIRHESHDIAASHTTEVPCACTNPEYCALVKGHRRHNGDSTTTTLESRKRRGRQNNRDAIASPPQQQMPVQEPEAQEETATMTVIKKEVEVEEEAVVKQEIKEEPVDEAPEEVKEEIKVEVKKEDIDDEHVKEEPEDIKEEEIKLEEPKLEEEHHQQQAESVTTRRASRHSQEQNAESGDSQCAAEKARQTQQQQKLSREERKLQAIMKAIERMEKQEQRRQEHQAKQAHRRESEPSLNSSNGDGSKLKRRKRKGRARTTSTNSRRNRLDSADSLHNSSDDTLLSPPSESSSPTKAAGLLLALANGESSSRKSPDRTIIDSNSNSAHSSPETPLSSACLLVAAAVEPLEPGFKFPKTKKVLMNEWLNKSDVVQSASAISPSSLTPHIDANMYATTGKNLSALAQAASYCDQPRSGSAKKRWLRQAISEDQCDVVPFETAAPPKKRRLPRESLSAETSPPTTPTGSAPPPPVQDVETGQARQEYSDVAQQPPAAAEPLRGIMDPRLASRGFASSDHLVGAVEQSLSFLGFEGSKKAETPAKRKLSITEYRQRKKLNNNEKTTANNSDEITIADESNSSQSPKMSSRTRSDSSSSVTSGTTSDDDVVSGAGGGGGAGAGHSMVPEVKALSAFNSEPTELERQRESVSLRLKRALGLPVVGDGGDEHKKTTLNVETILKGEIPLPTATKCTLPLSSPNFPIPGSAADATSLTVHDERVRGECVKKSTTDAGDDSVTFYTPDDEDAAENASYVPPFNNPVYPNNSYATYGSVIDDDAPYEGRNPSPPPEIHSSGSNP